MSSFLRFPRELRDRIYAHVLYEPDGVVHRRDKRGVVKICKRPPACSPAFLFLLRKVLFRLVPATTRMHRKEANQLKYVCRQLHRETRNLTLRLNFLVVLEDDSRSNPFEQCRCLLHCVSLRQVTVACSKTRTFDSERSKMALSAILAYCRKNAAVTVRVRIPHWSQVHHDFMLQGVSYLLAIRKDASLVRCLARATSVSYLLNPESHLAHLDRTTPSNLRWLPREEKFDPQLFERVVAKHHLLSLPSVQPIVAELKECAEGWFAYGL